VIANSKACWHQAFKLSLRCFQPRTAY